MNEPEGPPTPASPAASPSSAPERLTVEEARAVAVRAHDGQDDKQGEPYLWHVGRVVAECLTQGELCETVAWLHDVLEDTKVTEADLGGFGAEVVEAVKALTRSKNDESYHTYIERVKRNRLATIVKISDLRDNLRRAPELPAEEGKRLAARYRKALWQLGERGERYHGKAASLSEQEGKE